MLEVKILKITHFGELEAKKLLPYLQNSDVYAPERTGQTLENALVRERWWNSVITSGMSRTQFRNSTTLASTGSSQETSSQGESEFVLKQYDYLFRSRIPIYFLERFSAIESAEVMKLYRESQRVLSIGMGAIMLGEVQGAQWAYEAIKMWESLHQRRDKEMARNLKDAEPEIRNIYSWLSKKDVLRLLVPVGAYHNPEKSTDFPVEIKDLRGSRSIEDTLYDNARNLILAGEPIDNVAPILVKLAEYKAPKDLTQIRQVIENQKREQKKFPF